MPTRTRYFRVNFGEAAAALAASSVYYSIVLDGGTVQVARTNSGVSAIIEGPSSTANGRFQVSIANFDDSWSGEIRWDDNGTGPRVAAASFDPYAAIANAASGTVTANLNLAQANGPGTVGGQLQGSTNTATLRTIVVTNRNVLAS